MSEAHWNDAFEIPIGKRHNFVVGWCAYTGLNPEDINSFWCPSHPLPAEELADIERWQSHLPRDEDEKDEPMDALALLLKKGMKLPTTQRVELTSRLLLESIPLNLYFSEVFDEWLLRTESGLFKEYFPSGNVEFKFSMLISQHIIDTHDPMSFISWSRRTSRRR
jgi:hypothetical protein